MKLEFLAISDTHLGEDCSVLNYLAGREHLWGVLQDILGNGDKFEVAEVILMGDIPDRCLANNNQINTQTKAFMETLGSAANISKGVYIPGNHDHTIWTKFRESRYGEAGKYGITGPGGIQIVTQGNPDATPETEKLLTLFFGYPGGSSWRAIDKEKMFDFVVANPLYARTFKGRTYVFTHGTNFRWDVTLPAWQKKLAGLTQLDMILGGIEIKPGEDVSGDEDMDVFERKVSPFVDSLWPSAEDNPITQSDEFWYLITKLGGHFKRKRKISGDSRLYDRDALPIATEEKRINKITNTGDDKSLKLFNKYFCKPMLGHLQKFNLPGEKITFVYGDTHDGGWDDSFDADGITHFRAFNTGGWNVHNKNDHPACHIFGVKDDGEEFMLDVSFNGVTDGETPILELAAKQTEHHKNVAATKLGGDIDRLIDYHRENL